MPLRECMEKTSHRDYKTWMKYLEEEWHTPSKLDWYLAQIASEIANVLRTQNFIEVSDRLMKFELDKPKPVQKETEEERQRRLEYATAIAKSRRAAMLGWTKEQRQKVEAASRKG